MTAYFENLDLPLMEKLADKILPHLRRQDVVYLQGDLGAGKTQFAKFLIKSASGQDMDVPSPTFTIVQLYDTNSGEIWHFDLYRLEDEDEMEAIGLDEAFHDGISLIEWPDRLGTYAPKSRLEITIGINPDETRTVTLTPVGPKWEGRPITIKGLQE